MGLISRPSESEKLRFATCVWAHHEAIDAAWVECDGSQWFLRLRFGENDSISLPFANEAIARQAMQELHFSLIKQLEAAQCTPQCTPSNSSE